MIYISRKWVSDVLAASRQDEVEPRDVSEGTRKRGKRTFVWEKSSEAQGWKGFKSYLI